MNVADVLRIVGNFYLALLTRFNESDFDRNTYTLSNCRVPYIRWTKIEAEAFIATCPESGYAKEECDLSVYEQNFFVNKIDELGDLKKI